MGSFTRDSAASAKLLWQDECLVPSLFLQIRDAAKVMGNWGWGGGGVGEERKRSRDLVHHKRLSTYESGPKRFIMCLF